MFDIVKLKNPPVSSSVAGLGSLNGRNQAWINLKSWLHFFAAAEEGRRLEINGLTCKTGCEERKVLFGNRLC
jgi:hypothetical protein